MTQKRSNESGYEECQPASRAHSLRHDGLNPRVLEQEQEAIRTQRSSQTQCSWISEAAQEQYWLNLDCGKN